MEQIAMVAQVAKGTLYARYSSKEALFSAMVGGAVERWSSEAALRDALLTDDIEQRLRHHAQTIASFMRNPEVVAMQRLLLSVSARFPELAMVMHERGFRFIVDLIARDIVEAETREGTAPRDPEAIAQLLVSSLSGYQMQNFGVGEVEDYLPTFANRVVDLIMAGRAAW
ncbi:TetR/AcrR family transcriptional regulator [Novosphingobium sp. P6W]|uniref:TetR/AcrR family transcriptional regulator n=1 Tax=Novosphingobium sp. P6W TaxID=1609758 RepID=UPI001F0526C4|nr:TetR/AcrR family transcriptional regulator [Novosphingobium sp. P6W]